MHLGLLAAAWLTGLLLGLAVRAPPLPLLLFALAALPLSLMLRLLRRSPWPALLCGVLLLGLWRAQAATPVASPLPHQEGPVVLEGWVAGDPEAAAQGVRLVLAVTAVGEGEALQPAEGRVLAYARPPADLAALRPPPWFQYGDQLRLTGSLEQPQPFGDFDYPAYLHNQGIAAILRAQETQLLAGGLGNPVRERVSQLRRRLARSLEAALPAPQAGLAQALLLGMRSGIPPEVAEDFRRTGVSHLLAVSGLQVSVLLALALGPAAWLLGRRMQLYLLAPLALIWAYALVSGMAPPVVRAAVMGSVYLAALALGRPRSVLPALALAAAVMTAVNPGTLTDISFQLSFAAMAGIALALPYQERLQNVLEHPSGGEDSPVRRWMRRLLAAAAAAVVVSAFATLATLPLVAFNFHLLPLSGIFVTVLSLPAQAAILAASGVTALAGLVHPALGEVSGWVAWFPLAYQTGMVALAPGPVVAAPWSGPASGVLTALWYGALAALLLRPSVPGGLGALAGRARSFIAGAVPEAGAGPRRRPAALLAVGLPLAVVGALLWARVLSGPDGRLHVYFFDVGQGDSILVVSPAGRQVLVDGGPGTQSAVRALAGPLAPWDRSLDLVVLTHPDADHAQGLLEVLERMDVGAVLQGVEDPASPVSPPWQSALGRRGIPALAVTEGHTVDLGEGLTLEVLNPPGQAFQGTGADRNNNGVVLRLVYGDASLMLMGDIEAPGEERLLRRPQELAADVLKVAHHGSRTSTTPEFLRAVNPSLAVVSVGASNRYGHPHPQVVERLQAQVGAGGLLRTDQQGTVEVISDGQGIWYRTQRGR